MDGSQDDAVYQDDDCTTNDEFNDDDDNDVYIDDGEDYAHLQDQLQLNSDNDDFDD